MQPIISTYKDSNGREFYFSLIDNGSKKLVIHFTAFFGDWGDRKEYKDYYKGYFHRYKMFSDQKLFNVLFLCDQYGITSNGTYYTGETGDFFVERAMQKIIIKVLRKLKIQSHNVISVGSSMGATGAIKFGLMNNFKSIIAISPHIDLDLCAKFQGREQHVAWICPDGKTQSPHNYIYTRQIRILLSKSSPQTLPRLFIHSCKDDFGVHFEQVVPFVKMYRDRGGHVDEFFKSIGGHSSDGCGKEILLDVIQRYFSDKPLEIRSSLKSDLYSIVNSYSKKLIKSILIIPVSRKIISSTEKEVLSGNNPTPSFTSLSIVFLREPLPNHF